MSKEQDYASDSDESDEDFCPEKEAEVSDLSACSDEDVSGGSEEEAAKEVRRPKKKPLTKKSKRSKKQADSDEEDDDGDAGVEVSCNRRTTRHMESIGNGHEKHTHDKDELESDEDLKTRKDSLWADFLSDVKKPSEKRTVPSTLKADNCPKTAKAVSPTNELKSDVTKEQTAPEEEAVEPFNTPKQIVVTEILDFAGEEVRVQKVVKADSIKENTAAASKALLAGIKRPAAGGSGTGLGSILNQIGKKKKISVLEKSQLDWNSFKQDEGIDEQLQTFNKGRNGFLERQDFLERTDLRQFQIEKNLRQSRRNQ